MRFQHFLTLLSGLVECMFFAGVTFGWASLVFVLKNEKYFQDLCPSPGNQSINATDSCSQQDEQFSLIFTVAGLVNNFVTLPCGYIFDHFGTAVTRFLSISIYTAATILIALSNEETKAVSFISCVRSSLFWFHFIWLSVMQLRHYMFIATLNPTLTRLSGGDPLTVSHYTNVFAVSQFCGILCAPWNGIIIDRFKGKYKDSTADLHSCVVSLAITATQCMLFSISATLSILPAFYATFILQVLNRSFLYGGNAAFLSIA
ncbi:solute carrier family 43 member 3 isoform X4, partial [Pelobates cultripes]